jgi:hypothetical protein
MSRTCECTLYNGTQLRLRRRSDDKGAMHGGYADGKAPPDPGAEVAPGAVIAWLAENKSPLTGTEGRLEFDLLGDDGQPAARFWAWWDVPLVGKNQFDQGFDPADRDAFREKYGTGWEDLKSQSQDVDGDSNHAQAYFPLVVVSTKLSAAAADGGPQQAKAPPDADAPQAAKAANGSTANVSAVAPTEPPRLIVALNLVPPTTKSEDATTGGLLKTVAARLDEGLDVVWDGAENLEPKLWDPNVWKKDDVEEQWARAITELLLGFPYDTPQVTHTTTQERVWREFVKSQDPKIAAAGECQALVTYVALSRGYKLGTDFIAGGLSCAPYPSGATPLTNSPGAWFPDDKSRMTVSNALDVGPPQKPGEKKKERKKGEKLPGPALTPGSFYTFNDDKTGQTQNGGAHMFFVLRVDKKGMKQAQTLDTGAVERSGSKLPEAMSAFGQGGMYDGEGMTEFKFNMAAYIGLAVPKPADEAVLKTMIASMKKTRPTCLARLVVANVGALPGIDLDNPSGIDYVSPFIRAYGDGETQNYTYARFMWSLRDLAAKDKEVWWFFYAPRGEIWKKMVEKPRSTKLSGLGTKIKSSELLLIGAMSSTPGDGKVRFRLRVHAYPPKETYYDADPKPPAGDSRFPSHPFTVELEKGPYLPVNKFLLSVDPSGSYPKGITITVPTLFSDP